MAGINQHCSKTWLRMEESDFKGPKISHRLKSFFCKKNEIASKKFISKLNSFTNFKYIFIILWQTRQIESLFSLKDKNLHKSHVIYEGECSCGENYVGETMRNLEVQITEHSNTRHTSQGCCLTGAR